MLRRILLLLAGAGTTALGFFAWNKRDELKNEVDRVRGERRSGAEGKPKVTGPRTAGGPRAAKPSGRPSSATSSKAASRSASARSAAGETGSAAARDPGAAEPPARARTASTPEVSDAAEGAGRSGEAGTQESRVTPRDETSAPTTEAAEQRCIATTNAGKRCTRTAEPDSEHCWQHGE